MEPGYFRSREFAIAGVLALIVLVGGPAGAILSQGFGSFLGGSPCDTTEHGGDLSPQRDTGPRVEDRRTERRVEYTVPDTPARLLEVALCTEVGTIRVVQGSNETLAVVLTPSMPGAHPDAIDAVRMSVRYDETGRLAVHVPQAPRDDSLFQNHGGSVGIELRVPANTTIARLVLSGDVGDRLIERTSLGHLHATADVGNVRLDNVTVQDGADFRLDVGDVVGTAVVVHGDVRSATDVGDFTMRLADVGNGSWYLTSDVGDVDLLGPAGDRYGYHVDIRTDVGNARAEVGGPEVPSSRSRGPSDHLHTETRGFEEREVQVRVVIRTDVGSGTVRAV